jgi:hypothetical protein
MRSDVDSLREEVRTLRYALRDAEDECEMLRELVHRRDEQLSALQPDWRELRARELGEQLEKP